MTDDNLAWEIMRDHYRTLYFCSPGFRETVNWRAQTYREMVHGGSFWLRSEWYTPRREEWVKGQHEKGVKALESFLNGIRKERPALAAEERHRGAVASLKAMSREDERFYRMLIQDLISVRETVRLNWYRRNQLTLEGSMT